MLALLVELAFEVFTEFLAARLLALERLAAECRVERFAVDFFAEDVFAGALTIASDSLLDGLLDKLAAEFAPNCGAAKTAASDVITRTFPKRFIIRFKPRTSFNCFRPAKKFPCPTFQ